MLAVAVALGLTVRAQPIPLGGELQINSYTSGAVAGDCTRCDATAISAFLDGLAS